MPCRKREFFVFRNLIFVMTDKKQTTRDFLSLYTDSGFQDSRPPSQGFFPKTRDFLQPLERAAADGGSQRRVPTEEAPAAAIASPGELGSVEHVLTGRLGTCGAEHVRPVAVKPEWSTYAAGAAPAPAESAERREEPKRNAFTLWEEEVVWPAEGGVFAGKGTHQQQQQQWAHPSPFPASRGSANGSFPSIPSSREQLAAEDKGRPMIASSRSGVSFADGDDEGEEGFGREEKPYHKGITVKVDGSVNSRDDSSSKDQKPSTPRSKHSATEQRRRTKINDRFQILRDLIPHSDQKRDKASFLLEVIEYIQFLQEKVQKYESSSPGWNQANAKFMPWKSQVSGASIVDHSHTIKDHQASTGFIFPDDSSILNAPTITSNNQNPAESENIGAALASKSASMPLPMQYPVGAASGFSQPQMKFISDSESMAVQPHSQWLRSSVTDASVSTDVLSGHEELTVDEGTTSLSSLYSERLRTTLTEALQRTGVDISQASISVQINPHRRTTSRQISSNKDKDDPLSTNQAGHSAVGNSGDESERASKRHKSDTS